MNDRLAKLRQLAEQDPNNRFARYGLAMEYAGQGQLQEASDEFRRLLELDPDYVPAYLQAGRVFEQRNLSQLAGQIYAKGIEVASRRGEKRAADELQAALEFLG